MNPEIFPMKEGRVFVYYEWSLRNVAYDESLRYESKAPPYEK